MFSPAILSRCCLHAMLLSYDWFGPMVGDQEGGCCRNYPLGCVLGGRYGSEVLLKRGDDVAQFTARGFKCGGATCELARRFGGVLSPQWAWRGFGPGELI